MLTHNMMVEIQIDNDDLDSCDYFEFVVILGQKANESNAITKISGYESLTDNFISEKFTSPTATTIGNFDCHLLDIKIT